MFIMKKLIPMIVIIFSFLSFPVTGDASYRIRLKNGGEFKTLRYWSEGDQIKFYIYGGIVGIHKDSVGKIEKTAPANIRPARSGSEQKAAKVSSKANNLKDKKAGSEVDIEYYKKKKKQLEAELKRALDRVREAAKNNDSEAREKARDEVKKISAKMYDLTAELIKKNNGKMPEGWWEKQ